MKTARSLCTPGASSCDHPSINTEGDDEGFIGLVCSPGTHTLFETENSVGRESPLSHSCPSGMWAVFSFGLHTTGVFDAASCQDDVSGRTCTSETYALYHTVYTNPAHTCDLGYCDGGDADTRQLNSLCACLPGHYKAVGACGPCSLGTRPTADMSSCEECPAGYYCPSPAEGPYTCGSSVYYCPVNSWYRRSVVGGYYTTGGSPETRTGQSRCEVSGPLDWCV